ncbi:MAG: hypothetical protein ACO1NN_06270 [Sphingopyxis sp.]
MEDDGVRVLPTVYNGIQYRSRCEARWAVVFDELGWQHHYEIEGFHLKSGSYLPDFFLPEHDAFFEVKGQTPTYLEKRLADELAASTQRIVLISHGPPNPHRDEWDRDLSVFYPAMDVDDEIYADWQEGGFVSRRWDSHPTCSIDLGNLAYLGSHKDVEWRTAFRRAANHRFGVFE